ncbi:MAG: hypothetical protein RBR30_07815 [Tenuifilaceae bacterium]|jgi:hypothetical protein|nr:hypothetical protein [Tenuifilaceae bacterium]
MATGRLNSPEYSAFKFTHGLYFDRWDTEIVEVLSNQPVAISKMFCRHKT